jgi:hypothetical protein
MQPRNKFPQANKILVATLAAAVIAAGAPAVAGAASTIAYTSDPIKVVSYSVESQAAIQLPDWGSTYSSFESPASLSISFVNGATVAATRVEFAVREGRATELVVDKGTFAPGTSITKEFTVAPQFGNAAAIEVREVTFADGSTWQQG